MTHVECSYDPCSSNFIDNVNDNTGATVFARAKHSFEGRNNDELSFRKGDVITVSQQLEGGWWEGTLRSNTGWFPSSYVVIIPDSERFLRSRIANNLPSNMPSDVPVLSVDLSRQSYRQQIMKGFVISEQNYANAIANFHTNILMKIKNSSMISDVEFSTLAGNLQFLVLQQNELLEQIKETVENDGYLAKIGGILLLAAPSLRYLHRSYCENHPRAVDLILRNRNKFEKIMSETGSSFNVLIHELSSPFRHLESYPSILNELERCMNAAHPDKGDTQRAASVFRDIVNECCFIRKQKEAQLELMHSDLVEGITSDQMKEFGEIIYMGIASVGVNEFVGDIIPLEKYLVLFPTVLLVLEITLAMNSYVLKNCIELSKLTLKKLDTKSSLLLLKNEGEIVLAIHLSSHDELRHWIESFLSCSDVNIDASCFDNLPQKIDVPKFTHVEDTTDLSPIQTAESSDLPITTKADNAKKAQLGFRFDHKLEMILPECSSGGGDQSPNISLKKEKLYSGYCLRPYVAYKGSHAVDYSKKANVKMRKDALLIDQEDAQLLRIVEGYCSSSHLSRLLNKQGQRSNNRCFTDQPPQLIVAEDEKILVEEVVGDEIIVQEKSLVDTVYALKDQISEMQKEIRLLNKTIDHEQKARRRVEESLRRLTQNSLRKSSINQADSESQ